MPTLTLTLDKNTRRKLNELAQARSISESELTEAAILNYIDLDRWQRGAIQKGIAQADAGALTDHDQIKERWNKRFGR